MAMNKFHKKYFRAAVCSLHDDEEPVQSGLAYTPSQMFKLAQEGTPVSTQSVALDGQFDMGYRDLDFEPPLHLMRHADFADLWEKSKDAHERLKKAVKEAPRKEVSTNA